MLKSIVQLRRDIIRRVFKFLTLLLRPKSQLMFYMCSLLAMISKQSSLYVSKLIKLSALGSVCVTGKQGVGA